MKDPEKLLQDMDVNRLRAVIYRDVVSLKLYNSICNVLKIIFLGGNKAGAVFVSCHSLFYIRAYGLKIQRHIRASCFYKTTQSSASSEK